MKRLLIALSVLIVCSGVMASPAGATGLKVAPFQHKTELTETDNRKKGFIDLSNPTSSTLTISTSVQGFRQVDNDGSLEFFDSEQLEKGVALDLERFTLKGHEAVRMFFEIDGKKLPSGDVFAAVFFTTETSKKTVGVGQSVRVGTLLSIVNGTPSERKAVVENIDIPFWQLGSEVTGSYTIKNVSDKTKATGFYPEVTVAIDPFHQAEKKNSSLVFAGNERKNDFSMLTRRVGLYQVSVEFEGSKKTAWVMVLDPNIISAFFVTVVLCGLLLVGSKRFKR